MAVKIFKVSNGSQNIITVK